MPEVLEVESYRRLAEGVVGARVRRGFADAYLAKKLVSVVSWSRAVRGLTITGTSRRGKLLVLKTDGVSLGVRFGMTGGLLVDGVTGIEGLFYGPHDYRAAWVRGGLEFDDGRRLLVHDPRRLARFEIDPALDELGPDVLTLTRPQFDRALKCRGDGPAVKARLLDQSAVAGIGNLLADEALFRACIDPRRPVGRLGADERARLFKSIRATMRALAIRGGSHTGDHMDARSHGAHCPRDGAEMSVGVIGGRTTYWCPAHQR
jgi:formamidopyrimidine-DNA glycosylase